MTLPTTPEAVARTAEALRKAINDGTPGPFSKPIFGPGGRFLDGMPILPFFRWTIPRRKSRVSPDMAQMLDDIERMTPQPIKPITVTITDRKISRTIDAIASDMDRRK